MFRLKGEVCGQPSVRNTHSQTHDAALHQSASQTPPSHPVWAEWDRKDVSRLPAGWVPGGPQCPWSHWWHSGHLQHASPVMQGDGDWCPVRCGCCQLFFLCDKHSVSLSSLRICSFIFPTWPIRSTEKPTHQKFLWWLFWMIFMILLPSVTLSMVLSPVNITNGKLNTHRPNATARIFLCFFNVT